MDFRAIEDLSSTDLTTLVEKCRSEPDFTDSVGWEVFPDILEELETLEGKKRSQELTQRGLLLSSLKEIILAECSPLELLLGITHRWRRMNKIFRTDVEILKTIIASKKVSARLEIHLNEIYRLLLSIYFVNLEKEKLRRATDKQICLDNEVFVLFLKTIALPNANYMATWRFIFALLPIVENVDQNTFDRVITVLKQDERPKLLLQFAENLVLSRVGENDSTIPEEYEVLVENAHYLSRCIIFLFENIPASNFIGCSEPSPSNTEYELRLLSRRLSSFLYGIVVNESDMGIKVRELLSYAITRLNFEVCGSWQSAAVVETNILIDRIVVHSASHVDIIERNAAFKLILRLVEKAFPAPLRRFIVIRRLIVEKMASFPNISCSFLDRLRYEMVKEMEGDLVASKPPKAMCLSCYEVISSDGPLDDFSDEHSNYPVFCSQLSLFLVLEVLNRVREHITRTPFSSVFIAALNVVRFAICIRREENSVGSVLASVFRDALEGIVPLLEEARNSLRKVQSGPEVENRNFSDLEMNENELALFLLSEILQ